MIRAAIVEDVLEEAEALKSLLSRYEQEEGVAVDVRIFDKPLAFLGSYKANYDVIFLDIEMPSCNGLEVAEGVRMSDNIVIIVFVLFILFKNISDIILNFAVNITLHCGFSVF